MLLHTSACYCTLLHAFLHVLHDSAYVWSLQEKTSPPVPWIPPSWASGLKLNLGVNSFLTNIYHLEPFSKLGLKGIKMISLMSSIISTPIIVGLNRSGSRVTSIYSCRAFGLDRYSDKKNTCSYQNSNFHSFHLFYIAYISVRAGCSCTAVVWNMCEKYRKTTKYRISNMYKNFGNSIYRIEFLASRGYDADF